MNLVLSCICHITSAVTVDIQMWELGGGLQDIMIWTCPACGELHKWSIPTGLTGDQMAHASRRFLIKGKASVERKNYPSRLLNSPVKMRKWIQLGELLCCWREAAGMSQEKAAAAANKSLRHWKRIEGGEIVVRHKTLEAIVRAVGGSMTQAFLLIYPEKVTGGKLGRRITRRRITRGERELSKDYPISKLREGVKLSAELDQDVELALNKLRRVLVIEGIEENFLFYALVIHQQFWNKLLGGVVDIEQNKTIIIPAVKLIIDVIKNCEKKEQQYQVVNVIVQEAKTFLPKLMILEFVTKFIRDGFITIKATERIQQVLSDSTERILSNEELILTLFDLSKSEKVL
jgi:transcriptional regulator with XRE-family HTH domain